MLLYDKAFSDYDWGQRFVTPYKRYYEVFLLFYEHFFFLFLYGHRPAGLRLILRQERFNRLLAHDRMIVENYFGRFKTLWTVFRNWTGDFGYKYNLTFRVAVIFTNMFNFFMSDL